MLEATTYNNGDDLDTLTKDEWIPILSKPFSEATNVNDILRGIGELWRYRKFEGVVPHCLNAARYRARQLAPQDTVVAVDAEGLIYAASHKREPKDVPDRVLGVLREIWKDTSPRSFIVTLDSDRRAKREMYSEYKASKKPDPAVEEAKRLTIDKLRESGIQLEIHDGWEADDVLGSIAFQSQVIGDACTLVTTDKDMWQTLGANVSMYGYLKKNHMTAQWLLSKHRIRASQAVDWLSLVGKNDVPGAAGVGADTASKLLEAHGDIPGILASDLTPRKREAIEALDLKRLREIHTLNRTLPIERARYGGVSQAANEARREEHQEIQ